MTQKEFNDRVRALVCEYNQREADTLEDAYRGLLCFGILLNDETLNNYELLLDLQCKHKVGD